MSDLFTVWVKDRKYRASFSEILSLESKSDVKVQINIGNSEHLLNYREFLGFDGRSTFSEIGNRCVNSLSSDSDTRGETTITENSMCSLGDLFKFVQPFSGKRRILQLRNGRVKKEFQAGEINYLSEETLTVFINGLRQTLSTYVITQRPRTVEEASRLAQEEEQRLNMFKTNTSRDFSNRNRLPKVSHVKSSVKCYSCGKLGHIARNCKSSGHLNQNKSNSNKQSNNNNNNRNQSTSRNFKVNAVNKVFEIRKEMINSPYIFIKVNGEYIKALIDDGADVSLILKEKVYEHQVNQCAKIKFNGIGGISENSIGKAEIDCLIGNTQHSIEFRVVERYILQDFDALLGIDFLKRNEASFNFKNNILTCGNEDIKIENDDFLVPSRHEVLRFVRVKGKIGENVLVPETKSDC
ncbi:unnamed protein product [Hermetia illucens]|uniref:CCHC-type domain-containing protein n=1 Tax=Hermetia illucens TaxID=343691 RepID=A0A7R8YQP5_HERIL|nr:unnamed protein product [Hermetia illucens]